MGLDMIDEDEENNHLNLKGSESILHNQYSSENSELNLNQLTVKKKTNKHTTKTVTFNLNFLNADAEILDSDEKKREYEKIIQTYRKLHSKEFRDAASEKVQIDLRNHRNPNVENLIKDLKEKSNATLMNALKKDFNLFIDQKVSKSSQSLKIFSELTPNRTFLTQQIDEETEKEHEISNNDNLLTLRKPSIKTNLCDELDIWSIENDSKSKNIIKENSITNNQISIIDVEKNSLNLTNSSLIKLKTMLDSIKRIDLPKFQNELHQVCQYGTDPQLIKLYPQVSLKNKYIQQNDFFNTFFIYRIEF